MKLVEIGLQFGVGEAVDDAAMFHHVITVRHRRGEVKILLHQEDRDAAVTDAAEALAQPLAFRGVEPARRFVADYGATWPTVLDPDKALKTTYRVAGRPQTYFIDGKGVIRSIQIGQVEEAAFDRILAVNLKGMWLTIKAAIPVMRRQGSGDLIDAALTRDDYQTLRLMLGDTVSGVIDFYFACNDMFAYDAVICLNAWCFEPDHSYNVTKGRELLQGYTRTRALSPAELEAIPLLARGSAMRFLLTRLIDWLNVPEGALVRPKNPLEYFRKLRFHQTIKNVSDYGALAERTTA